jgi:ABC-type multidrug transport system fused ATPase/permease subunit
MTFFKLPVRVKKTFQSTKPASTTKTVVDLLLREKLRLALNVAISIGSSLADVALLAATYLFIQVLLQGPKSTVLATIYDVQIISGKDSVLLFASLLIASSVFASISRYALFAQTYRLAARIAHSISVAAMENIASCSYPDYLRLERSAISTRLQYTFGLSDSIIVPFLSAINGIIICVITILFLLSVNAKSTLIVVSCFTLLILCSYSRLKSVLADASVQASYSNEYLGGRQSMLINAFGELLLDGRVPGFIEDYSLNDGKLKLAGVRAQKYLVGPRILIECVATLILALLVIFNQGRSAGILVSQVGMIFVAMQRILPLIQSIVNSTGGLRRNWYVVDGINKLLSDLPGKTSVASSGMRPMHPVVVYPCTRHLPSRHFRCQYPFDTSYLAVSSLSIGYCPDNVIASGIEFSLAAGDVLGIIGSSGSGKSTLLATLAGLVDPLGGSMELCGTRIAPCGVDAYTLASYRSMVSYVWQAPYIIDSTILHNIVNPWGALVPSWEDVSSDQRIELSRLVEMTGLAELAPTAMKVLELPVGAAGSLLSGGQCQRIAIARALFQRKSLLILDEPTSALDQRTEVIVFENIVNYCRDSTLVVVSHRPLPLEYCTKILRIGSSSVSSHDE